jgi:HAD superfamily hydrolase (TIGR01549 family)
MASIRIKTPVLVFDQGNTLLMDPFPAVMQLQKSRFQQVCNGHGVAADIERIVSEWTRANSRINYPYIGHFYQEEPIVQDALRNLGVSDDIAAILALELLREYRVGLRKVITVAPRTQEVKNTLEALEAKGKRMGVFSNDRSVALGFVLSIMEIKPFFEYIETSESIAMEKPDPRVFQHIVRFFGVRPEMVAYVGDDPIKDIEAAKIQGLTTIRYLVDQQTYNESWRDYGAKSGKQPDVSIQRFSELLEVIE